MVTYIVLFFVGIVAAFLSLLLSHFTLKKSIERFHRKSRGFLFFPGVIFTLFVIILGKIVGGREGALAVVGGYIVGILTISISVIVYSIKTR